MKLSGRRLLVTGGAGLIGSHLAATLAEDNDVTVVDDCSTGDRERVPDDVRFAEADLTDPDTVTEVVTADLDAVFHLAAAKAVNADRPRAQFEGNAAMTYNLLERMDEVGVRSIAFTSSSTVYGEAPRPTPEDYAPLAPISVYGATKLAEEGLLSAYAGSNGFTAWVFRFANIPGPMFDGSVIPDFVEKLSADPETLTILGDGRQEKSYLHVEECVDAMRYVVETAGGANDAPNTRREGPGEQGAVHTFNLGTRTTTSVRRIADIVAEEMGLDPEYEFTGGDRGWVGDVPKMRLSVEKLAALGWEPPLSSDESVRKAVRQLTGER